MLLDTGFRPSRDGFGFPNTWHDTLLGVIASRGRCGGMVYAALDAFASGSPLPPAASARELPAHDAPLSRVIWRRQIESVLLPLGANLCEFARYTYLPSSSPLGVAIVTRRELLRLFDGLRSGRPQALGLVSDIGLKHLPNNHQVLAYAAEFEDGRVSVRIYDPNHPQRDDVVLDVPLALDRPVTERVGDGVRTWRGFFIERYAPDRAQWQGVA